MRIVLPEALRDLADGRAVVEMGVGAGGAGAGGAGAADRASGPVADTRHSVGGVLGALSASHPGLYDRLMTEQGALRPHVNIFVDGDNIRFTGGLGTRVGAGSEIFVLPAISGG
ncbi:MAG: MoaD/ThiS family protein [Gammaproteobacteria bacterium]|nr:MoaD/ThiS family protein [Gammaproteobacteria bacterium]